MPRIDFEEYQTLMYGCRTARKLVADAELWRLSREQLETWLREREGEVERNVSAEAGTPAWEHHRARATLELAQAAEFWRDKFRPRG